MYWVRNCGWTCVQRTWVYKLLHVGYSLKLKEPNIKQVLIFFVVICRLTGYFGASFSLFSFFFFKFILLLDASRCNVIYSRSCPVQLRSIESLTRAWVSTVYILSECVWFYVLHSVYLIHINIRTCIYNYQYLFYAFWGIPKFAGNLSVWINSHFHCF